MMDNADGRESRQRLCWKRERATIYSVGGAEKRRCEVKSGCAVRIEGTQALMSFVVGSEVRQ